MRRDSHQLDLFTHIACAYAEATDTTLDNVALYNQVAQRAGVEHAAMDARVRSDNSRVLAEHSARHQRLMHAGGEQRSATYGDGDYQIHPGSYANPTVGKIPRNVILRGHTCRGTRAYRQHAARLGLPLHGGMQPTAIADFFIRFLSEPDDLVVDPFGGTIRTGLAAERLGRRSIVTEWILEYLRGAAELFRHFEGFGMHPALASSPLVDHAQCKLFN